jgi:hypothetical protein
MGPTRAVLDDKPALERRRKASVILRACGTLEIGHEILRAGYRFVVRNLHDERDEKRVLVDLEYCGGAAKEEEALGAYCRATVAMNYGEVWPVLTESIARMKSPPPDTGPPIAYDY